MVNVLVIGAAGYIGNAVAIALRRGGHKVWGLVRKAEQAEQLKLNEIIPIIGDISDVKVYEPIYDLVSHIVDGTGRPNSQVLRDSIFSYAKKTTHRKITFLHTSGFASYGPKSDGLLKHEDIHRLNGPAFAAPLIETEENILNHPDINGVSIRVGWVFGGTGGNYLNPFFAFDSTTGDYEYKGNVDKIWNWIHCTDLGDLYLKIVEAPSSVVAHQAFNAVNDSRVKTIDVRTALARAAGAKGKVILLPADNDPFSQTFETVLLVSNEKAKRLLKWAPKFELIDEAETLYQSWKAAKAAKEAKK